MSPSDIRQLLSSRAVAAGLSLDNVLLDRLDSYFRLLAHWSAKINLTGFSLDQPGAPAVDRLLIEPLLIARAFEYPLDVWFDLGSGGGSPAIPIQLYKPARTLVLVESKERKAAFLREVAREMGLEGVSVEVTRIESIAVSHPLTGKADLVTIRAVKPSEAVLAAIRGLLRTGRQAAMIGWKSDVVPVGLQVVPVAEFASAASLRLFSKT